METEPSSYAQIQEQKRDLERKAKLQEAELARTKTEIEQRELQEQARRRPAYETQQRIRHLRDCIATACAERERNAGYEAECQRTLDDFLLRTHMEPTDRGRTFYIFHQRPEFAVAARVVAECDKRIAAMQAEVESLEANLAVYIGQNGLHDMLPPVPVTQPAPVVDVPMPARGRTTY